MLARLVTAMVLMLATSAAMAAPVTLTGEVTYRERLALPTGAVLRIQLVDTSAAGSPTRLAAEAPLAPPGQVPLVFNLNFDSAAIDPAHAYAIVAEIAVAGEIWFRTPTPLKLDPLAAAGPVQVITALVRGQTTPGVPASPVAAVADLIDVTWRTEAIRGVATDAKVASTLTISGDMRAGGRGGCNSYFAQARLDGDKLAFSAVGATMMACTSPVATAQEAAYFDALAAVRFWRLEAGRLLMLDADGGEILRFAPTSR